MTLFDGNPCAPQPMRITCRVSHLGQTLQYFLQTIQKIIHAIVVTWVKVIRYHLERMYATAHPATASTETSATNGQEIRVNADTAVAIIFAFSAGSVVDVSTLFIWVIAWITPSALRSLSKTFLPGSSPNLSKKVLTRTDTHGVSAPGSFSGILIAVISFLNPK